LRFGAGVLPRELELGAPAVMAIGAASIAYGSLQAVSRRDTSEMMAYSAIGQAGYVLLALGVGGPVGYAAAVVYAVVNSLNKGVVFLSAGLRGPLVGAAFAVGAFSIAGVPPAAGFLGKLMVFETGATLETLPAAVALVTLVFLGSALSFLYSFQVYQRRFVAPGTGASDKPSPAAARYLVALQAAFVLLVGLWPQPLVLLCRAAAEALTGGPG
jgi:multicomponent Na+:H+ antiporter subunit D